MDKDAVAEEMAAGPRTVTPARRTVTTATVVSTRTGLHTEETALETRKVHAGEVAATKPPVEVEDKTTRDVAGTVIILPITGGKTPRRLSHEAEEAKEQANVVQGSTSHAWFTQVQEDSSELKDFKLVV